MKRDKSYLDYLSDIKNAIEKIEFFVSDIDVGGLEKTRKLYLQLSDVLRL